MPELILQIKGVQPFLEQSCTICAFNHGLREINLIQRFARVHIIENVLGILLEKELRGDFLTCNNHLDFAVFPAVFLCEFVDDLICDFHAHSPFYD